MTAALLAWALHAGASAAEQQRAGAAEAGLDQPPPEAAAPAEGDTARPALPTRPAEAEIFAAWSRPGSQDERSAAARALAFERGARNLDGPARSLLLDTAAGAPIQRAQAAVDLAPDLPDAHLALARASWSERREPGVALAEVMAALGSLPRHLQAASWFEAALLHAIARAAVGAAALFLLAALLAMGPAAASQLGGALPGLPVVSSFAWVAVAVAAPVAFGEGWAGIALGAVLLVLAYGSVSLRLATLGAVALLLAGLHPLTDRAADRIARLGADPVADAAWQVERGFATPFELARLARADGTHPLAARALAVHARREGALEEANRRFSALLEAPNPSPALLHNAANVRFALGHDAEAIALYERAVAAQPSAASYWNLSQAHGRSIHIDEQDEALQRAQQLDTVLVEELTEIAGASGGPVVLDLPLEAASVQALPIDAVTSARLAADLRRPFAPGRIGGGLVPAALVFGVLGLAALLAGTWLRALPSASADEDLYAGIARVLQGREATDPSLRRARLTALRDRRARHDRVARVVALLVPGAAGALGRHPLLGLLASASFAVALATWAARPGVVADPVAAGATGALVFGATAVLAAVLYVASTAVALLLRERS
jgi:tetratricopeptide (TPR) repeat protein